jgi:hypothetical protein
LQKIKIRTSKNESYLFMYVVLRSRIIEILEYPEYLCSIADEYIVSIPDRIKKENTILIYFILLWFLSKFVYESNEIWSIDTIAQVGGIDKEMIIRLEKELFQFYLTKPDRLNKLIYSKHDHDHDDNDNKKIEQKDISTWRS